VATENTDWCEPEGRGSHWAIRSDKTDQLGSNRWGFKPEVGYSRRFGNWLLDTYGGVWFYTTNHEFFSYNQYFSGLQMQSENPVGAFEGHLSYDVKARLWFSVDGNFWWGGETTLKVANPLTRQEGSRVGVTASIPISKHQSAKVNYSNGAYISYGGNYQNISAAWQYSWIGRPN
jgi:hypothetical protein